MTHPMGGPEQHPLPLDYAQPHSKRKPEMRRHGDSLEIVLEPLPHSTARSVGASPAQRDRRLVIGYGFLQHPDGQVQLSSIRAITVGRSRWLPGPVELLAWPVLDKSPAARARRARTGKLLPDEEPFAILFGTDQDDFDWLAMALRRVCGLAETSPGIIDLKD